MWRALVSHLVVCCPPQQGQKSQQRLSIFYVERNYEEWGWWDPEGRSHKLRAYSGRHLRRSGVVWSRLEKKKEDSLRIVINGRTIKDNKLYGYRWGENIRPRMPPPHLRYTDTLTIDLFLFVLCLRLEKKRSPMKNLDSFFFFPSDCFFLCGDVGCINIPFAFLCAEWMVICFCFSLVFRPRKKKADPWLS